MKKLTYLISAIAAAFSANAYADISVSGSGSVGLVNDRTGDNNMINSGTVSFGMSTTTAGGLGISASMGLSVSPTSSDNAATGTGGQQLTFTSGGSTVVVGDITIADTPGSVGGVVSANTGENTALITKVGGGFYDDDGAGVSLTTGVGGATFTVAQIFNTQTNSMTNITDSTAEATAFGVSVPVAGWTVTLGTASHDDTAESSGGSISGPLGGGTLTVGMGTQKTPATISGSTGTPGDVHANVADIYADSTAAGDAEVVGVSYAYNLDADTTVSIGYQRKEDQDADDYTRLDVHAARSLGGGASVYIDMRQMSASDSASSDGTAFGFGTAVSF